MLYRLALLNRWYNDLERKGPAVQALRFLLFMGLVGLPFVLSFQVVDPWFLVAALPLILMRLWWLSSGAAALRSASEAVH